MKLTLEELLAAIGEKPVEQLHVENIAIYNVLVSTDQSTESVEDFILQYNNSTREYYNKSESFREQVQRLSYKIATAIHNKKLKGYIDE